MFLACNNISGTIESKFEREKWLSNNDWENLENPRFKMTQDLLDNYLRPGLTRDSILTFLGQPHDEKIIYVAIEGATPPDSLNPDNFNQFDDTEKINQYANWVKSHRQPDTIILFHVGWRNDIKLKMQRPNFLVIKMNSDSIADDFWIEEK
jgi:hypothetical protein